MSDKPTVDKEMIRELAGLLDETGLTEIEVENGDQRVRIVRAAVTVSAPAAAPTVIVTGDTGAASVSDDPASHPGAVVSPMIGTVYISPEPNTPPFVNVGDQVNAGQTLLIVEAMKTMNPIPAPKAGKVTQILVSDGSPVEYGEALMIIE